MQDVEVATTFVQNAIDTRSSQGGFLLLDDGSSLYVQPMFGRTSDRIVAFRVQSVSRERGRGFARGVATP